MVQRLDDLPERVAAPIPQPAAPEPEPEPEWPPLALCVLENMRAFPNCMLLTRVGGFYECYFDQAPQLASHIGIKLATRRWAGQTVPMAGFPIHQLEKYLKVLVQDKGLLVAICEEFKETNAANAAFQRRVTRVVSAGTLIDERFLDPFSNNFILAVSETCSGYGLAWLDVSTADFQTSECADQNTLRDEIVRVNPREVVLMQDAFSEHTSDVVLPIWEALDIVRSSVSYIDPSSHSRSDTLLHSAAGRDASSAERAAIAILTRYLETRLMEHMNGLHVDAAGDVPRRQAREAMHLNAHTLGALEIRETSRDGSVRGSLASILRRTMTQGGSRLFAQWLSLPSTSIPLIQARHKLVDLFLAHDFMRNDVRHMLRTGIGDILRTLQRLSLRRNDEQDLLEIRDFVHTTDAILVRLRKDTHISNRPGWDVLQEMLLKFRSLSDLGTRLGEAIDERVIEKRMERQEALLQRTDAALGGSDSAKGAEPSTLEKKRARKNLEPTPLTLPAPMWGDDFEHLIRPDASPVLRALTDEYNALRRQARRLENSLRNTYQEPVTLKFLLGQGHVVHFPSARGASDDVEDLSLAYKTKTTRTYYHAKWTKIGMKLQKLASRLSEREAQSLEALRQEVLQESASLRRNARLIDQLDVLLSFAQAAEELSLVQPMIDDSTSLDICGARHLSVEMGLLERQRLFTKNDLFIGERTPLHLITGPNMGGKSTFLRQNAIIVVLAQAGSFIPAESARMGIVDQIFSRVGAKDDLFHARSTFMVEMSETAEILCRATSRSLVIADEIGRGTNTAVGLSIAFATMHTLATKLGCRTLFATHYYELADLLEHVRSIPREDAQQAHAFCDRIGFFCTTLEQHPMGLRYSHRVRPGVNRESHGLEVARIADMPQDTMDLAARTHAWLQSNSLARLQTHGLVKDLLDRGNQP
ncbi:hypothetical protein MVES1_000582 [Malassezia vespertilionis]|uniref:Msh1p n=1 Tax=Malassezia vespertilionis TaxID=2020962 RepID=A0A2N1JGX9_9BASI|nr:uncharacterized protein MVES1_000582 [Malassezia vespertilionis]PKI85789.1 Msh1p [Malassezia vespertilionis]WFD05254.1 hypothetical protein MVES1_000582 [Malassezia vespertilionis]